MLAMSTPAPAVSASVAGTRGLTSSSDGRPSTSRRTVTFEMKGRQRVAGHRCPRVAPHPDTGNARVDPTQVVRQDVDRVFVARKIVLHE